MAEESVDRMKRQQMLSELADGELDAHGVREACALWREDDEVRRKWHAYQLIGDVLRSEDLAAAPSRDAAFLAALRQRLADEPVVLAPSAESQARPARRRAWAAPMAVAAGFMAVAGVLVVTRLSAPVADPSGAAALAAREAPADMTLAAARDPAASAEGASVQGDLRIVRDPRLDRYLAAHKQFGAQSAVAVPVVSLRHATHVPER